MGVLSKASLEYIRTVSHINLKDNYKQIIFLLPFENVKFMTKMSTLKSTLLSKVENCWDEKKVTVLQSDPEADQL